MSVSAGEKLTPFLVMLLAVSSGIAVGNLYWAQPLLAVIATAFNLSTGTASALITSTQIGYALGILFIVPLGDALNRRKLIPRLMLLSALALAASAVASDFILLLLSLALVGVTTVAGQLITPLASSLASQDQRGKIVGTIVSGMLIGILLSRTISGFLGEWFGWRAIYLCAAVITAALAFILSRNIPDDEPRPKVSWLSLLSSIFVLIRQHRTLQVTLLLGFSAFAVFTLFWTGLTFLLSSSPYSYSLSQIGLVGLVGLAGAIIARRAGWLHDNGYSVAGSGVAIALTIVALGIAYVGASHIGVILASVLLLDIAIQTLGVLNQTRLLSLSAENRSRLNTAYVACNFIGGALGSALAGTLWNSGGWALLMICAAVLMTFCLLLCVGQSKTLSGNNNG
jgi:predicted MFS family arabinose efflux permease